MMFPRRKQKAAAPRTAMVEQLDPRLILDAPLMLASDGLVLADPTPDELLEPAVFVEAEPAATVPPSDEPDGPDDPEPLPKVDAKSDAKSGPTVPMTTMSSGTLGTATLSVLPMGGVNEAGSPSTNTFRFRGESCGATTAPSSITVFYTLGGTAEPDVDFEGAITSGYLTIPMSGSQTNKSGDVYVPFSVRQDQIDEVTETLWVDVTSATSDTGAPVTVLPPYSEPAGITDDDIEWAAGDPIEGTITTDAGPDPAIPINGTLGLSLSATDRDRKKDGGVWSDYYDDVTSGNTAADHHVKWTASEGKFIVNGVPVDTAYGTTATYLAPDYADGQNSRTITVTAAVDDFNRGDDVQGFDDNALDLQQQVIAFQVELKVLDAGQTPNTYNGVALDVKLGGKDLGWTEFGKPPNCEKYGANVVLEGRIGAGGPPTGYTIVNYYKGRGGHKLRDGTWHYQFDSPNQWKQDFVAPPYQWSDLDTRSPNGPGNPDTRRIYALDAPGVGVGPNNDGGIAGNNGAVRIEYDLEFQTLVAFNGGFISKPVLWRTQFVLEPQGGRWAVVGNHIP
jgi:hypothetical protein